MLERWQIKNRHSDPSFCAEESDEASTAADGKGDSTQTGDDRKQMKNRLSDPVSGGDGGDVKAALHGSPGEGTARTKQQRKRSSRSDSPSSNRDGITRSVAPSKKRVVGELPCLVPGETKALFAEDIATPKQKKNDHSLSDPPASQGGSNAHGAGEASADAEKGKNMLMGEKDHNILSASCFGDVNINKAEDDEPGNKFDPPPMDRDIEHIGGAQDSCINIHEGALVVDNYIYVNLRRDQSIPPASHNHSRSEESAWTQEKKPNIPSPSMEEKVLVDHKQEQGAGQLQDLDLDEDTAEEQINYYFTRMSIGPPRDEDFWTEYDEPQLTEVYQRLALYRIKAYELLSTGKELDIAELKVKYPLHVLQDNCYFKHYEESLEWYFHPEHCRIAGLSDYQRLVLYDDGYYGDWDYCRLNYHTYQGDLEYVQYCDEMSKEIKWIEDKVGLDEQQWQIYDCRAYLQALKTATRFHNIFRHSVIGAYSDYLRSIKFDFNKRKDFDGVYLEIWKQVAKQKMDFNDALEELYEQNMFPSRRFEIKLALQKDPPMFRASMKNNYDTYVACIDEKISEEDAHLLIIEAVKKMIPKQKTYLDYVRKKLEITELIGLIPKRSSLDVTAQGREGNAEAKPAIAN